MTYSSAIFPELDADLKEGKNGVSSEGVNGGMNLKRIVNGAAVKAVEAVTGSAEVKDELEEAQLAKLRSVSHSVDLVS